MHRKFLIALTILICTLIIITIAIGSESNNIKILSSSEKTITLELSTSQTEISTKEINGIKFNSISIKDYSHAYTSELGKPQIPIKSILIGIPLSCSVNLQILNTESLIETKVDNVIPIIEPITNYQLPTTNYQIDRFYPNTIAELGNTAFIRDQRVIRVELHPVQYNPATKDLMLNKRIVIKLDFSNINETGISKSIIEDSYENLYKSTIINYEQAKQWRGQLKSIKESSLKNIKVNKLANLSDSWKINITKDGIYCITYYDLINAGFSQSEIDLINPQTIQIFNLSNELAIYVEGEGDSKFDTADYIIFYGWGNKENLSDTINVFWLTYNKVPPNTAKRMNIINGAITDTNYTLLTRFWNKHHFEENKSFKGATVTNPHTDWWTWDYLLTQGAPVSKSYNFNLSNIDSNDSCYIELELIGNAYSDSVENDHHTKIYLNGNLIDEKYWDGLIAYRHKIFAPQSYLINGLNTITVEIEKNPLLPCNCDFILFNWYNIEYWDSYVADSNPFRFGGEGTGIYRYKISNFPADGSEIYIFDYTDSVNVKMVSRGDSKNRPDVRVGDYPLPKQTEPPYPLLLRRELKGGFTLEFQDELNGSKKYIALTHNSLLKPFQIIRDTPSSLANTTNQADYIIITHDNFYQDVLPLKSHRENQSLNSIIINISDIYDEFNYGILTDKAIKDFLTFAYYNWTKPAPQYVFLVGDGSYDFKDYYKTGNVNFIPTHFHITHDFGINANDNWFVEISGDDVLPDMSIGRITPRTQSSANVMISKIINYENMSSNLEWTKNLIFVADNSDAGGNFTEITDTLIYNYVSSEYHHKKLYVRDYIGNIPLLKARLIDSINTGGLITYFLGHGSVFQWAAENIFNNSSVSSIANNSKPSFFINLSCDIGMFVIPTTPDLKPNSSLAEELMYAENGGAISIIAPTAFTYIDDNITLSQGILNELLINKNNIVGQIFNIAKINLFTERGNNWTALNNIRIEALFGDPATNLKIPINVVENLNEAPIITITVDGQNFIDGDYISKDSKIVINVSDNDGIKNVECRIKNEECRIKNEELEIRKSVEMVYQPNLEDGSYTMSVSARDIYGNVKEAKLHFTIESKLRIDKLLNYPNPMRSKTDFTYILSKPAHTTIKIYTVAGRLIKVIETESNISYNSIAWDGTDIHGNQVANGTYIYKLIANDGKEKVSALGKVIIMR